jgi:serine/threonine-protein kinase
MAVVFLAQDLKHNRNVALKVIRSELSVILGGDRFLKEIQVTANLQHPNILPLYDSGEAGGFLYYVMPLMENETLADRLEREHQLPLEEALEIAKDVSAAVDYAHRQGLIHRDIKPSNILLHDGKAIVADFGVALAMSKAGRETRLTETGLSVGTPHYMSPEQAAGDRELDARSDLCALGAVVFEMLVGEPPHVANTAQAVVAKILTDTPAPISRTRELVPPNVEAAVAKALARSPADRFGSVADFSAALTNPSFTLPTMAIAAGAGDGSGGGVWRRLGPIMTGATAVAALIAVWGWAHPQPPDPVSRYNLAFLPGQEMEDFPNSPTFDVASGGAAIVYVGPGEEGGQLWVKHRDQLAATALSGTDGARAPSISPDGTEVVFYAEGQLRKVPVQGGAPITLADTVGAHPAAWVGEGTLVYRTNGLYRLRRVPVSGGPPQDAWLDQPDGMGALYPSAIHGTSAFLFTFCDPNCATTLDVWVDDLDSGEGRQLIPGAARAWYVESGHVVFVRPDGAVFGALFDTRALELTGPAVPLLEGVKVDGGGPDMALTPDGTRLAIGLTTEEGDDIWIKELDDGPLLRLTYDPAENARPRWSSDGQLVYFLSRRREQVSELYVQRADGAGDPLPVLLNDRPMFHTDLTPDGAWLVARTGGQSGQTGGRDIMAYHLAGDTVEAEDGSFRVTSRTALFELPAGVSTSSWTTPYDISPDDQEFIMVRSRGVAPEDEPAPLILVENWLEEVRARMGSEGG